MVRPGPTFSKVSCEDIVEQAGGGATNGKELMMVMDVCDLQANKVRAHRISIQLACNRGFWQEESEKYRQIY